MDIQTEKIELAQRLLNTDDEGILLQVKQVFENQERANFDALPSFVREGIERSKKQAEAGLLTPHEEVIKKYSKYL